MCGRAPESRPALDSGQLPIVRLEGAGGRFVAFSPDGTLILTVGGKHARVWDAVTYKAITQPILHAARVETAQFTASGNWVFTATSDEVRLWRTRTGTSIGARIAVGKPVLPVSVSFDGSRIATSTQGAGARAAEVTVWDTSNGRPAFSLRCEGTPEYAEFSPDGTAILMVGQSGPHRRSAVLWDATTGSPLPGEIDANVNAKSLSIRGSQLACSYSFVAAGVEIEEGTGVWDLITGKRLQKFDDKNSWSVAFSPNGQFVAVGGPEGTNYTSVWRVLRVAE